MAGRAALPLWIADQASPGRWKQAALAAAREQPVAQRAQGPSWVRPWQAGHQDSEQQRAAGAARHCVTGWMTPAAALSAPPPKKVLPARLTHSELGPESGRLLRMPGGKAIAPTVSQFSQVEPAPIGAPQHQRTPVHATPGSGSAASCSCGIGWQVRRKGMPRYTSSSSAGDDYVNERAQLQLMHGFEPDRIKSRNNLWT